MPRSYKDKGDSRIWARRLGDFVNECAGSAPVEEADRVREAVQLLQGSGHDAAGRIDPAAIEAMLACGAGESAVMAIMGRETSFMLSRGEGGTCLATVIAREGADEAIAEGATLALALLGAHVASVLAGVERIDGAATVRQPAASLLLH